MRNLNNYIVFFSQIIICYIIIITSLVCIVSGVAISKEYSNLFLSLTSSAIGYVLPNPSIKKAKPSSSDMTDSHQNVSTHDGASTCSYFFKLRGRKVQKSEIVFFSQIIICYIIIVVSISCLAIGNPSSNDYLFTILCSPTLGYLLPSPKLHQKKDGVPNNPPSNSSSQSFPNNTISNFNTYLPEEISLDGEYEVALTEIQYTNTFYNIPYESKIQIRMKEFSVTSLRTETVTRQVVVNEGYYQDLEQLLNRVTQLIQIKLPDQVRDRFDLR